MILDFNSPISLNNTSVLFAIVAFNAIMASIRLPNFNAIVNNSVNLIFNAATINNITVAAAGAVAAGLFPNNDAAIQAILNATIGIIGLNAHLNNFYDEIAKVATMKIIRNSLQTEFPKKWLKSYKNEMKICSLDKVNLITKK